VIPCISEHCPLLCAFLYIHRCVALFGAGLATQFKYCFAWTLAEAGFIFAGLSFEGWEVRDAKEGGKGQQMRPKWWV